MTQKMSVYLLFRAASAVLDWRISFTQTLGMGVSGMCRGDGPWWIMQPLRQGSGHGCW